MFSYIEKLNNVVKEVFSLRNYKKMPLVLAILSAIAILPFALAGAILLAATYVFSISTYLYYLPFKAIKEQIEKDSNKSAFKGTEIVIYIVAYPLLFASYVVYALSTVAYQVLYVITLFFVYVASLGGINCKASFLANNEPTNYVDENLKKKALIFVIIAYSLVVLYAGFSIANVSCINFGIRAIKEFGYCQENIDIGKKYIDVGNAFGTVSSVIGYVYFAYVIVYTHIIFRLKKSN